MTALLAGSEPAKIYRRGTERTIDPEETYARILPLMKRIGVTRVANVTGLDRIGIPVFMVCRPNSRSLAVSQGKGITATAARVSGMMESLECHHAERIARPLLFQSWNEMRARGGVIDFDRLQPLSGIAYSRDVPLLWIEGRRVRGDGAVWIPFDLVHVDMTQPAARTNAFMRTSNGLASGNTFAEAVAHGLWETIERDCVTLWDSLPLATKLETKLDTATVDDPVCRELLEIFSRAAIDVAVWDIANDLRVPCFGAMIRERDDDVLRRVVWAGGFGCHPRRAVALARALTEAAQSRLTAISGSRDDLPRDAYESAGRSDFKDVGDLLFGAPVARSFGRVADFASDTFEGDLAGTLDRLSARGIDDVIVVDLTRDDIGIPVAKVVVPGLERPLLPGYLPGPRARVRTA